MIIVAKCFDRRCKHYRGIRQKNKSEIGERNVCAAYPNGIPYEIEVGEDLHLEVRRDQDNDIVYERKEET